jgi:hypothetical protein
MKLRSCRIQYLKQAIEITEKIVENWKLELVLLAGETPLKDIPHTKFQLGIKMRKRKTKWKFVEMKTPEKSS